MSNARDPREEAQANTHFGFREVPAAAKNRLVGAVFHSVAPKYDLMNDVMSFGIHRLWKQFAIAQSGARAGSRVLDVAGGTGDLAAQFANKVGTRGTVVIADINASMLEVGRTRLADRGLIGNIEFVQADAEKLPFPNNHFDCISIAFGLRNVTHQAAALQAMFRVLKPGGKLIVLEFSRPALPALSKVYDFYSFTILPLMGRVIANDEASYRYLAESIRKHPDQETLKGMMQTAGFERVAYHNLTGGIVALHKGFKF